VPDVVPEPEQPEPEQPEPGQLERSQPTSRAVTRDSLGVGLAVGTSGLTFGAAGVAAGLSVPQCCAMSLLMFTGASQFALVGVLGSGGSAAAGAVSAVALGIRNAFYGIRLASLLRLSGARRVVSAQVVTDESTAMATAQTGRAASRRAFFVTGATLYVTWNLATVIGAVSAGAVGDPDSFGIDAAVPAAFLALVAPRLRDRTAQRTALLAIVIGLVAVPLTPVGVPVLLAAIAVLPVLRRPTADGPT
jgi:4-azaleucine resistance transporter AzlC